MEKTVSVIIPTWKPDRTLLTILERLRRQTLVPVEILIINTEEEKFPFSPDQLPETVSVFHISKAEFNHGGTRDMAARMAKGDLLVFMTMDAVPADTRLIQTLAQAFDDEKVAAAYARQLPRKNADELEKRFQGNEFFSVYKELIKLLEKYTPLNSEEIQYLFKGIMKIF